MGRCLDKRDRRADHLADFITESGKAVRVMRRLARLVPFLDAAGRKNELRRPGRTGQTVGNEMRGLATLFTVEGRAFDQPVMRVERPVGKACRNVLPSGEIYQIDASGAMICGTPAAPALRSRLSPLFTAEPA